ncbi:MAG: tyrosinase family protein [Xanthobacteraceae bacterium]
MSANPTRRVRRSLTDLQDDYSRGNKKPLEDLMRAWKGIKELPPGDPRSFFMLGGYHGEPFRGAGWGNSSYWGGYCMHGNILFPTWHRAYLFKLEQALQSIPGCAEVMLPFWDECSDDSLNNGIPWALTQENFELDGQTIANPLGSFALPANIVDQISGDNPNYSKPKGYKTVRYPLSGLVGNDEEKAKTAAHNAQYQDYDTNVRLLNQNIVNWLHYAIVVDGKPVHTDVYKKYQTCLDAPNYTVFSNATSAAQWNENLAEGAAPAMPLESPHNSIHLAVGGFDVPNQSDTSPIAGANGDMGENDTAGLDPIFFFHHCFVDRVFWLWQKKHGCTDKLDVIAQYPGTNSVDSQGPTPGVAPNSWLTLESPLDPFKKSDGTVFTTRDCINIETQLGYTYGPGSLEDPVMLAALAALPEDHSTKVVRVRGINRAAVRGSFMISAFATIGGKKHHLGTEAVLSRWHVDGCANCQTHLEAKAFIGLHGFSESSLQGAHFDVEVHTRDGLLTQPRAPLALVARRPFSFEVR